MHLLTIDTEHEPGWVAVVDVCAETAGAQGVPAASRRRAGAQRPSRHASRCRNRSGDSPWRSTSGQRRLSCVAIGAGVPLGHRACRYRFERLWELQIGFHSEAAAEARLRMASGRPGRSCRDATRRAAQIAVGGSAVAATR